MPAKADRFAVAEASVAIPAPPRPLKLSCVPDGGLERARAPASRGLPAEGYARLADIWTGYCRRDSDRQAQHVPASST